MYEEDRQPAKDIVVTLKAATRPQSVKMLGTGRTVSFNYTQGIVSIALPASIRTNLVDVLQVEL